MTVLHHSAGNDPVWDVVYLQETDHAEESFEEPEATESTFEEEPEAQEPTYSEDFTPQEPTYSEP